MEQIVLPSPIIAPQPPVPQAEKGIQTQPDASRERVQEAWFMGELAKLSDRAYEERSVAVLVDCLAWYLAVFAVRTERPWGPGDIMRRLGNYICKIEDRQAAAKEAEERKSAGVPPN